MFTVWDEEKGPKKKDHGASPAWPKDALPMSCDPQEGPPALTRQQAGEIGVARHESPRTWPGRRARGWRRWARPRCQAQAGWSTGLRPPLQSAAFQSLPDPNPEERCAHGLLEGPRVLPTSRGEGQGAKEETSQADRAGCLAQHRGAHGLKKELVVGGPVAQAAPLYVGTWRD